MNYEAILVQAMRITRQYRYLLLFGLLAGWVLGERGSGFSNFVQGGAWIFYQFGNLLNYSGILDIISVIIAIALFFLGVLARISLIQEVDAIDSQRGKPSGRIGPLVRSAVKFMPRIIGMQAVVWLPVFVLILISTLVTQQQSAAILAGIESGQPLPQIGALGYLPLIATLIGIFLLFIDAFAYRAIVIEDLGVKDGIRRAIRLLRTNGRPVLILSVVTAILGVIFVFLIGLILSPILRLLTVPLVEMASQCNIGGADSTTAQACLQEAVNSPALVIPGVILSIVSAVFTAPWIVFQSSAFTIAFHNLTVKPKKRS